MVEDGDDGVAAADDDPADDGRSRGHADRRDDAERPDEQAPRETVDDLSEEDLTDIDEMEGITVGSVDEALERGSIDRENALFVLLGIALSVVVFLEFLSVLPGV
jgi:hypothetical protein